MIHLASIFDITNNTKNNEIRYCSCYAKSDQTDKVSNPIWPRQERYLTW